MTRYTWEQVADAIEIAGGSADHVRKILDEAVNYSGQAVQGPDSDGQETYEPRSPAEKAWADRHRVEVFDPAGEDYDDGTDKIKRAAEPSSTTPPRAEVTPSFSRIKKMMSNN